jgi:hypothetical protein
MLLHAELPVHKSRTIRHILQLSRDQSGCSRQRAASGLGALRAARLLICRDAVARSGARSFPYTVLSPNVWNVSHETPLEPLRSHHSGPIDLEREKRPGAIPQNPLVAPNLFRTVRLSWTSRLQVRAS